MHTTAQRRPRLFAAIAASGLALGLTLLVAGPAAAAPSTTLTLSATPAAEVGGDFDVTVGLSDVVDVFGYAITLSFDPAVVGYTPDTVTGGPTGGFDSVQVGNGTVTLVHSRLGTSPVLAGTLPANLLDFVTVGPGDATITATVSLVGADGATSLPVSAAPVTAGVIAAPVPPVTSPAPGTPGTSPADTGANPAVAATSAPRDGSLALTGFDGQLLLAFAVFGAAAIVVGFVVVRRRTAVKR
jgi:hypothetical protein